MGRIQNKLLTGTIIVMHLEKEKLVVKDIEDIKKTLKNHPKLPRLMVSKHLSIIFNLFLPLEYFLRS